MVSSLTLPLRPLLAQMLCLSSQYPPGVASPRHLANCGPWEMRYPGWLLFYAPPPHSRSLNELRVLLLEANRHSPGPERDLSREVHKAEWRIKEQKLKDDIRGLREKLTGLVCGEGGSLGMGDTREGLGWPAVRPWRLVTSCSHPRDSQITVRVRNPLEPLVGSAVWLVEGPWEAPFVDIMAGYVAVWVM